MDASFSTSKYGEVWRLADIHKQILLYLLTCLHPSRDPTGEHHAHFDEHNIQAGCECPQRQHPCVTLTFLPAITRSACNTIGRTVNAAARI